MTGGNEYLLSTCWVLYVMTINTFYPTTLVYKYADPCPEQMIMTQKGHLRSYSQKPNRGSLAPEPMLKTTKE